MKIYIVASTLALAITLVLFMGISQATISQLSHRVAELERMAEE